jgi:hypothetical protein
VVHGKAALKQAGVRHQQAFFWARLCRIKAAATYQISHTGQAPARVDWKMALLADIALQALYPTRIDYLIGDTKYQLHVRRFLPF